MWSRTRPSHTVSGNIVSGAWQSMTGNTRMSPSPPSAGASATRRRYAASTSTTASSVAANRKPRKGERRAVGQGRRAPVQTPVSFHQDEGQEVAHDPRPAPEALQVHGPAAPLHQTVLSCRFPLGAPPFQHFRGCHQPRPHVRPGSSGGALWQVGRPAHTSLRH